MSICIYRQGTILYYAARFCTTRYDSALRGTILYYEVRFCSMRDDSEIGGYRGITARYTYLSIPIASSYLLISPGGYKEVIQVLQCYIDTFVIAIASS